MAEPDFNSTTVEDLALTVRSLDGNTRVVLEVLQAYFKAQLARARDDARGSDLDSPSTSSSFSSIPTGEQGLLEKFMTASKYFEDGNKDDRVEFPLDSQGHANDVG